MEPDEEFGALGPKKEPKSTLFWVIVVVIGVVAWIALELVDRGLS
jgi:hypothetical protein